MYHRTILIAGLAGVLVLPWSARVGAQEVVPRLQEATPQVQEAVPQPQETVPQPQAAIPQPQEALPQQEAIPQPLEAAPQAQQEVPLSDDIEQLRRQLQEAQEPVPLNRGPIHEAFAEPFTQDPEPGLIVPREPPEPVEEIPPDIGPDSQNLVWFSGYWGWDAELEDFVWVSGAWRRPPPYQRWVPGYWNQVAEGWQWVSGTWVHAGQRELQYLPEPPESLEEGPTTQAPSDQHIWVPGCWMWQQNRYMWRPGYWTMGYDNWVWMPHRHMWTPYGSVFAGGYWDYPFARRGWLFSPFFFPFHQPGFMFSPFTPYAFLHPGSLFNNFWIWPGYRHYFFGNFFGLAGRNIGFFPWHQMHGFRRGYDPLFWHQGRMYPGGINAFQSFAASRFDGFVRNPRQRPPNTMRDLERFRGQVDRDVFDRGSFSRSLQEGIARGELGGSRRLDERQRRQFADAGRRMNEFSGQRRQLESQGARQLADGDRRGRRPQNLGLPSTRSTEMRDVRSAPQARQDRGVRQQVRRPDMTRPDQRRLDAARPDQRRLDTARPDQRRLDAARPGVRRPEAGRAAPGQGLERAPGRQVPGRTPDIRPGPGPSPLTPQFRGGGSPRPSAPQFRGGGSPRPTAPQFRGGGSPRPSAPQFRGGGGGRPSPSIRGGGGGRGGSPARAGGGGRGGGR